MPGYFKRTHPFGLFINIRISGHFKIRHSAAFLANKMIMRRCLRIESVKCASKWQFLDMPLLNKNIQIAINSAETQPGNFLLQFFIHPIGGRMRFGPFEHFKNSFPLLTPPVLHNVLINNSYYYQYRSLKAIKSNLFFSPRDRACFEMGAALSCFGFYYAHLTFVRCYKRLGDWMEMRYDV